MKQVFVGGTGRSGTTILSKWLGSHPSISRFPFESRFVIDAGGIMSLFHAVTRDYSMDQARMAYQRFLQMMQQDLTNGDEPPYQGIDLAASFGPLYREALQELDGRLRIGSFDGWDFHSPRRLPASMHRFSALGARLLNRVLLGKGSLAGRLQHPAERIYAVRHLGTEDAITVFGQFLRRLFDGWARSTGAQGWCEDTPGNACHLNFLTQLVPESRHLCVVRNPYGTALSYTQQVWAPSDFSMAVELLASLFSKIIEELDTIAPEQEEKIKVVKLEDLSEHETRADIRSFVGIPKENSGGTVYLRPVSARKERERLSPEQRREVEQKLGFVIEYFGYDA